MRKRKLTPTQELLLDKVRNYISEKNSMSYDTLKSLCEVRSFDKSFNALLEKNWVMRDTNASGMENKYKLTL